ncbi:MAG TPA: hypothetical protein PLI96_00905 [Halothiobacillus sp.]|nr:hypothetical protein [Halothiobacillus sp.]
MARTIIGITWDNPVEDKNLRSYPQEQRDYPQLKINSTHRLKLKQVLEVKILK